MKRGVIDKVREAGGEVFDDYQRATHSCFGGFRSLGSQLPNNR